VSGHTTADSLLCLYCYEQMANRSIYLEIHIATCTKAPLEERRMYASRVQHSKSLSSRLGQSKIDAITKLADEHSTSASQLPFSMPSLAVQPQAVTTTAARADSTLQRMGHRGLKKPDVIKFEQALATFFFKKGISFDALADEDLKDALNLLNCTYKFHSRLSRFRICNEYLTAAYLDVKTRVEASISESSCVCVLVDGWTSAGKSHFLNVVAARPSPVFVQLVPTGSNRVTAEFQCDAILKCLLTRGISMDGFCSDNAAVMKKTWKLLESKQPSLIAYGCAAHSMQSFGKSVAQYHEFTELLSRANRVSVYFSTHTQHHGLATLREAQSLVYHEQRALPLSTDTRWHSSYDSVAALLRSRDALLSVVNSESWRRSSDPTQMELNALINDFNNFWDPISAYCKVTKPIKLLIKMFESDRTHLNDVLPGILALASTLQDRPNLRTLLVSRSKKALTSWHIAAFLLDHVQVRSVSIPSLEATEILSNACQHVNSEATIGDISHEVSVYISQLSDHIQHPHAPSLWTVEYLRHQTPLGWWHATSSRFPLLAKLAIKLLQFPSSAAAAERVWSAAGDTLGNRRTRLLSHRLEKLVYIRFNGQLINQTETSTYKCPDELKSLLAQKCKDVTPFISHLVSVRYDCACSSISSYQHVHVHVVYSELCHPQRQRWKLKFKMTIPKAKRSL
jgi:hypothetical protein